MRKLAQFEAVKNKNRNQFLPVLLLMLVSSVGLAGCVGLAGGNSPANTPGTEVAITGAQASVATNSSFHVAWNTNVPASTQAEYGTTAAYGASTAADSTMVTAHQVMISNLKTGTLYHFRVHSTDAQGISAVSADMTFATTGDTVSPTVSIASPAAGATLSGMATISANASDNVAVASVQFKIDGANVGSAVTAAPFSYSLNTSGLSNGNHVAAAVAKDAAGNSTTSGTVSFKVDNTTSDKTAPTVAISAPANNATVSATITISANASDNVGVAGVQFKLDGSNFGAEDTASPYSVALNTATIANGNHTLTAVAHDAANNMTTSAALIIKVSNTTPDKTAPTVALTSPANSATVKNTINVTANAADNTGVASLQFQLDGTNVGSALTAAPYSMAWDTTKSAKGTHTLRAIAKDAAGNSTTSAGVTVTVNNAAAADTTAPTVSLATPANGSTVSGTVTVSANAADNVGVASVQFQLDGANAGAADTGSPYSYSWDTTKSTKGSHTLRAIAKDAAGNSTTSASVTVTVGNAPTTDTTAPSVPTGLTASAASSSQINLTWNSSTDNVGVSGYRIYRGGSQIATSTSSSYQDSGLSASTGYSYTVSATDAAGNVSGQSGAASATTQAAQSGGGGGSGIPSAVGWFQIPNSKMDTVCPNLAAINASTGCAAVISGWSSGLADTKRNRLLFFGGGHSDYAGNEVYSLDLNTLTMNRLTNPSLPAVECVSGLTNPVAPNSRHTYAGVSYIPSADQIFLFAGAVYRGSNGCQPSPDPLYVGYGGRLSDTWTMDVNSKTWKRRDPLTTSSRPVNGISGLGEGVVSDYDPVTDRVIVSDDVNWYSYDQAANTYTLLNSGYQNINYQQNGVIDPVRRIFFTFGGHQLLAYDLKTNKISEWTSQVTGCDALVTNNYPGLAYDPTQKKIVGWSGGNTVYVFDPDAKSCQAVTYPNGPNVPQTEQGTFGRFRYFPALGVFALVNDYEQNAFTLRLTAGNGTGSGNLVISAVSTAAITTSSFTTSWTTSAAGTSQLDYGTTTSYGTTTAINNTQVTNHAITVNGLQPGTLYHYRVRSKGASGTETVSNDFAVSTNTTADATPPTVSLNSPGTGSTVTGPVTLTATATDNVAVAGVQFLLDGNNAGAELTSSPFSMGWDSTTSANGSHTIAARARDAAGNMATSTASTITVSNTTQPNNGTADFSSRCKAAGVTLCEGFDDPADFTPNKFLYPNYSGVYKGTMDTTNTASGAGSLKFEIDPFTGANNAGYWTQSFGQDFGEGTTFYVQFRQKFSDTMLSNDWGDSSGNTSWKQAIFHKSGHSCTDVELTTTQHYVDGIPIMYTDCGSRGLYTNGGTPPYLLQQGDYNCSWGTKYSTNPSCFSYAPDVWVTFYYKVSIGHWGQADSSVESWVALPGQPLKQWIKMLNFRLDNGSPGNDYNTVDLLPYMTGKDSSLNHPVAFTWYDELIVSKQPIAAPKP